MIDNRESINRRWDIHTERQIAIVKAGSGAVTILNSGSWLALLTQVSSLQDMNIGWVLGFWALGALLGTLIWLFLYVNAVNQMEHDFDRENAKPITRLRLGGIIGMCVAVGSLASFGAGALLLALVFM